MLNLNKELLSYLHTERLIQGLKGLGESKSHAGLGGEQSEREEIFQKWCERLQLNAYLMFSTRKS